MDDLNLVWKGNLEQLDNFLNLLEYRFGQNAKMEEVIKALRGEDYEQEKEI